MSAEKETPLKRSSNAEINSLVIPDKVTARALYQNRQTRNQTLKNLSHK